MTLSANYTVKSGDTLSKIAARNNTTVAELAAKNGIQDVNKIEIGQKLIINDGEGITVEKEPAMSEADFEERFKQQQEEINKLKNRTLSQQAKEEIADVTMNTAKVAADAAVGATAYSIATNLNAAKTVAGAVADAAKYSAETNWNATKAVAGAVADATKYSVETNWNAAKTVAGAAATAHNAAVDVAEDSTRFVANMHKKTAKTIKNAIKFDIPPEKEEKAPDFSKMTKEEILAYQQQQIEALKNESLSDKAKKEIKAKIRAAQSAHNAIVDGAYNIAKGAYHTVADGAKKLFGWMKW